MQRGRKEKKPLNPEKGLSCFQLELIQHTLAIGTQPDPTLGIDADPLGHVAFGALDPIDANQRQWKIPRSSSTTKKASARYPRLGRLHQCFEAGLLTGSRVEEPGPDLILLT